MLDLTKSVQTRNGKKIIGLRVVTHNSAGREVTFPVKGSIFMGKGKPLSYNIWTLDGRISVINQKPHPLDIVNVE